MMRWVKWRDEGMQWLEQLELVENAKGLRPQTGSIAQLRGHCVVFLEDHKVYPSLG